jgi:hypothetical protein
VRIDSVEGKHSSFPSSDKALTGLVLF